MLRISGGGGATNSLNNKTLSNNSNFSVNIDNVVRKKRLNGATMFTILFALFLMVVGITIGITYSAFQSTATSSGTLSFAVNGHQGTLNLSNTQVHTYNTSNDTTTIFTLTSDTGYTIPVITAITMGSTPLTKDGNNFKSGTNVVATYSSGTLTINNVYVTGNLSITGSSTANTYAVTIARNNNSYGTVSAGSVANVPYGTGISTNNNTITVNGTTITATPTSATGYTTVFTGWTNIPDKITSATTITANFTRTANTYMVSLDNQGAATSGTISVMATYGSAMPSITAPTKAGYIFDGYFTAINGGGTKYYNAGGTSATTYTGTSNTTLYAKWTLESSFSTSTWSQIKTAAQAGGEREDGSGTYGFKVGDIKEITIDSLVYHIRIADIREPGETVRYTYNDGTARNANIVFELVEILQYTAIDSTGNADSWVDCTTMRDTLNGSASTSVKNRLPSDLRTILVACSSTGGSTTKFYDDLNNDYLFLPSVTEIFGATSEYEDQNSSMVFDYYAGYALLEGWFVIGPADHKSDQINGYGAETCLEDCWWLRSCNPEWYEDVYGYSVGYFDSVDYDGGPAAGAEGNSHWSVNSGECSLGISFCFAF